DIDDITSSSSATFLRKGGVAFTNGYASRKSRTRRKLRRAALCPLFKQLPRLFCGFLHGRTAFVVGRSALPRPRTSFRRDWIELPVGRIRFFSRRSVLLRGWIRLLRGRNSYLSNRSPLPSGRRRFLRPRSRFRVG